MGDGVYVHLESICLYVCLPDPTYRLLLPLALHIDMPGALVHECLLRRHCVSRKSLHIEEIALVSGQHFREKVAESSSTAAQASCLKVAVIVSVTQSVAIPIIVGATCYCLCDYARELKYDSGTHLTELSVPVPQCRQLFLIQCCILMMLQLLQPHRPGHRRQPATICNVAPLCWYVLVLFR